MSTFLPQAGLPSVSRRQSKPAAALSRARPGQAGTSAPRRGSGLSFSDAQTSALGADVVCGCSPPMALSITRLNNRARDGPAFYRCYLEKLEAGAAGLRLQ